VLAIWWSAANTTNIRVANWAVGVADVGEVATRRLIAVEADKIYLEKEENTKECHKYSQACIFAVQEMRTVTLSR
jgi:hypothetical protein